MKGRRYASGLAVEWLKNLLVFKGWDSDQLRVTRNLNVVRSRRVHRSLEKQIDLRRRGQIGVGGEF